MIVLAALSLMLAPQQAVYPQDHAGYSWFQFHHPDRFPPFAILHVQGYWDGLYPTSHWETAFAMGKAGGADYFIYRLRHGVLEETDSERCEFRVELHAMRDLSPGHLFVPGARPGDPLPTPAPASRVSYTLVATAAQPDGDEQFGPPVQVTLNASHGELATWGDRIRAVVDACEWRPLEGWTMPPATPRQ